MRFLDLRFEILLGIAVRQAQALSEAEGEPGICDFPAGGAFSTDLSTLN